MFSLYVGTLRAGKKARPSIACSASQESFVQMKNKRLRGERVVFAIRSYDYYSPGIRLELRYI